jgi:hypothetical protein
MISVKELSDETYSTLKPLKEYKSGLLVYNKSHFKENLVSITVDIDEIKDKSDKGWNMFPGKYKFILQAPEVVICDLSEVHSNPTFKLEEIYTLFKVIENINFNSFIKRIVKKHFKGLEVIPINGVSSGLEVRVAGSDDRVRKLPKIIYENLKKHPSWKKTLKEAKKVIKSREIFISNKDIERCDYVTRRFYSRLLNKYSVFEKIKIPTIATCNCWKDFPKKDVDVYIFVPKSGLKYAFGFLEEIKKVNKIMLWECHLSLDITKELILFNKNLQNKNVAIIDRSYSSNTLEYLKKKVIERGGNPIRVALFPKSEIAVHNSDYILFLDKFIQSKKIKIKKGWQKKLFIDTVNKKF